MSYYYQGVIVAGSEVAVRAAFSSLDSFLLLRLTRLCDGVFGIYPGAPQTGPETFGMPEEGRHGRSRVSDELCRIAAILSQKSGYALWDSWDSCVGAWSRLYRDGSLIREITLEDDHNDKKEAAMLMSMGLAARAAYRVIRAKRDGLHHTNLGLAEHSPIR